MQELITAGNTVGMFQGKIAGVRIADDWTLLVITSIERAGERWSIKAEFLDSLHHEVTEFACASSAPIFEVGDFLSKRSREITFLQRQSLAPVTFAVGGYVELPRWLSTRQGYFPHPGLNP